MAIQRRDNFESQQRVDVPDLRAIESAVSADFDTSFEAFVTGAGNPYIINGFAVNMATNPIGGAASNLQVIVSAGALMHVTASQSGTIYLVPAGTSAVTLNASTVTNVSGAFIPGTNNYVGIDYYRFQDPSTDVQKELWDPSTNQEDSTIAPAAIILNYEFVITSTVWASNILPIAIVLTDSGNNVISITDSRPLLFRLGTGGSNPNPFNVYSWPEGTTENPVTTTSNSSNPFYGGDKAITDLKDWMNAVMTELLYLGGGPYWYSLSGVVPVPSGSVPQLREDAINTIITGSGDISTGILPNAVPVLITTGNITVASNQLTSLASTSGLAVGQYIFGTGIPARTTVVSISGSTVTMSEEAVANTSGVTVSFYSPSVITSPGQVNWDEAINIQIIGSELAYVIAANASNTYITLSDDEVAYLTLVRDVSIGPNLIFTSGSPTVTSVGSVVWTTPLLAGDYIKVASDTHAGYYKILTVNSTTSVTLTTNVLPADNYPGGTPAQYAFGSYEAVSSPSGNNRAIQISTRETVPINPNTFWLFAREDDGGTARVYIRFLGASIDNGESLPIGGGVSEQLLKYIGSPSQAASSPQYVSALDPGSVAQITDITIGAGSTISPSQYFLINSSGNVRNYVVWFKVNGSGSASVIPNTNSAIEVDILSSDSSTTVATELADALIESPFGDFTATSGVGTVVVTNTSAGTTNSASNGNVGAPFAITTAQSGTGVGNAVIHDGDNLTLAIKELDQAFLNLYASLDSPTYDEVVEIVASGATPPTSLNGPVANSTVITIPLNSRESDTLAQYTVGKGTLQVYLNGQFLDIESGAYSEVGTSGTPSNQIEILTLPGGGLVVGDELEFRIGAGGGGGGSGGQGSPGPAGPTGPQGPAGFDAAGGPVPVSTKTSSYAVLNTDCFLAADCTSGNITFTLFAASGNTGRIVYIKKIDSSGNTATVVGNGSDTIDGSSSFVLSVQYQSVSIISTGSGWYVF